MCMLHAGRRQCLEVFPRPFFRDLTFIGRSTEHRERHFGPLKRDCNFLHIAPGVVGQEALAYYHSAPIGLNIHAEPELSWEPRVEQLMAFGPLPGREPLSPDNARPARDQGANLAEKRLPPRRALRANKRSESDIPNLPRNLGAAREIRSDAP